MSIRNTIAAIFAMTPVDGVYTLGPLSQGLTVGFFDQAFWLAWGRGGVVAKKASSYAGYPNVILVGGRAR
jgi:hypothetical protein